MTTATSQLDRTSAQASQLLTEIGSRISGLISVGCAAYELESPLQFFHGRDRPIRDRIDALTSLLAEQYVAGSDLRGNECTQLSALWSEVNQRLIDLCRWQVLAKDRIIDLGEGIVSLHSQICDALQAVACLFQLELALTLHQQSIPAMIRATTNQLAAEAGRQKPA